MRAVNAERKKAPLRCFASASGRWLATDRGARAAGCRGEAGTGGEVGGKLDPSPTSMRLRAPVLMPIPGMILGALE